MPASRQSASLEVEELAKAFGSVEVLAGVSFRTEPGELLSVLGPSGSGKSTLLRLIAGFERPDSGRIRLGERDLVPLPPNRRPVNTVFQSYALFPHLTVARNVAFGLESRRLPTAEVRQRVGEALELLELGALADRMPDQLSGGQRQRVALARALVNEPELLLLDEPMSALDAKLRAQLQLELRRLQRELGKTFLLVTHDQAEALTVSDRILVLDQGRIAQIGTPSEVYERPRSRFVAEFLGAANLLDAEALPGASVRTEYGELQLVRPAGWRRGTLAIRPERIRVHAAPPARNGVEVTVVETVYRGDALDLWCDPGRLRVRLAPGQASPGLRFEPGSRLWLELAPEDLEVLVD